MSVPADLRRSDDHPTPPGFTLDDLRSPGERAGRPPVVLTIAGSDPSGGAGIQADLKTFSALGAYGTAVITALTAQSTQGVTGVHTVPPEFVRAQLDTLVEDVHVDAIKIGMLAGASTVRAVADFLREFSAGHDSVVVLDPVMVSTTGSRLLADDAVAAIRELLPLASVITPNVPEAAALLDQRQATDLAGMRTQGRDLLRLGARRVLLKGGHLTGSDATDLWIDDSGEHLFTEPRVETTNTHGTGCSLSSALAALAVRSGSWTQATGQAKRWLTGALEAADSLEIGHGSGPVHHFYQLWTAPALAHDGPNRATGRFLNKARSTTVNPAAHTHELLPTRRSELSQ